jgi:hypothetical protein
MGEDDFVGLGLSSRALFLNQRPGPPQLRLVKSSIW